MSKKLHSTGYPRKFSDKIALIKQKEALTNAYFESAIQGLPDIPDKRLPKANEDLKVDISNKSLINENYHNKPKDDFSSTSFSPMSFTSDSSINNTQNENYSNRGMDSNREFQSEGYRPSFATKDNLYHNLSSNTVNFRHSTGNHTVPFQPARFSNIEGYPRFSNNLMDLNEQICSGSMPDVSTFNGQINFQSELSERNNRNSINMKEILSNFDQMKRELNSKKVLYEHLKTRGFQNNVHPHPHHIVNTESTPKNLTSMVGSPSLNRNRIGYTHNHDDSVCAANNAERGYLKHYHASNIPYLSLPVRDVQYNNDCDNAFRKRHVSGNVVSPANHMELQRNNETSSRNDGSKYKSLTPTGILQRNWLNPTNEFHLLPPVVYDTMHVENCRRVASDSAIQNSLKECTSNIPQNNLSFNTEGNYFGKGRYSRDESAAQLNNHRVKSMTSERNKNLEETLEVPKSFNLERDLSISSSLFLDNYVDPSSPDENLDPNLDFVASPDKLQCQSFKFGSNNKFSEEPEFNINNNSSSCQYEDGCTDSSQMFNSDQPFLINNSSVNEDNFNVISKMENINDTNKNDECYWTLPKESNQYSCSREPSPKIKPCENLDPKNVDVDLTTNFSWIPEVNIRSEEDIPRRDSLNMAVEVLNNLNMESPFSEINQYKDKLNGFNYYYQPMDSLSEETSMKNFENEY